VSAAPGTGTTKPALQDWSAGFVVERIGAQAE